MTFAISSSDSSWTSKLQFIPNALQLSRFFIAPSLFDGHLLCLLPGRFGPGDPDFENPVPEHIHRGGDLLHFGGLKPRPPRGTEEGERPPEEILKPPLEFLDRGNPFCGLRLRQFLRLLLRHESPPALHNLGNNPCLPASEGRNRPGMIRTNQSCPLHAGWRVRCRLSP